MNPPAVLFDVVVGTFQGHNEKGVRLQTKKNANLQFRFRKSETCSGEVEKNGVE